MDDIELKEGAYTVMLTDGEMEFMVDGDLHSSPAPLSMVIQVLEKAGWKCFPPKRKEE